MARRLLFDGALEELGQLPLEGTGGINSILVVTIADAVVSAGAISVVSGDSSILLDGVDSASIVNIGVASITSRTLVNSDIVSTGSVAIDSNSSLVLSDSTISSTIGVTITGVSINFLEDLSASSSANFSVAAALSITLDGSTLESDSVADIIGTSLTSLADSSVNSNVGLLINGDLSHLLGDAVVASSIGISVVGILSRQVGGTNISSNASIVAAGLTDQILEDISNGAVGAAQINASLSSSLHDSSVNGIGYIVNPSSNGILLVTLDSALTVGIVDVEVRARVVTNVDNVSMSGDIAARLNGVLDNIHLDSCRVLSRGHRTRGPSVNNTREHGAQEYRDFLNDIIKWMDSSGTNRFTIGELHLNRVVEFANRYPSKQNLLRIMNWLNSRSYVYRIRGTRSLDFYWYVTDSGRKFASGSNNGAHLIRSRSTRQ